MVLAAFLVCADRFYIFIIKPQLHRQNNYFLPRQRKAAL